MESVKLIDHRYGVVDWGLTKYLRYNDLWLMKRVHVQRDIDPLDFWDLHKATVEIDMSTSGVPDV